MRPFCVGIRSGKMAGTTTVFLNNPNHSKTFMKFIRDIGESKTKHVSYVDRMKIPSPKIGAMCSIRTRCFIPYS